MFGAALKPFHSTTQDRTGDITVTKHFLYEPSSSGKFVRTKISEQLTLSQEEGPTTIDIPTNPDDVENVKIVRLGIGIDSYEETTQNRKIMEILRAAQRKAKKERNG